MDARPYRLTNPIASPSRTRRFAVPALPCYIPTLRLTPLPSHSPPPHPSPPTHPSPSPPPPPTPLRQTDTVLRWLASSWSFDVTLVTISQLYVEKLQADIRAVRG